MTQTNQQVVDAIFKEMDDMGLSEKNWIKTLEGNWDTVNRQLWECLVAFYLKNLGYQPNRFSQAKTNLDFGFSINEKPFYGECVCPSDGTNPDAFKPWSEDEYQPFAVGMLAHRSGTVSDSVNQAGLRITNVFYDSKNKAGKQKQAKDFHVIKRAAPTIVFLCTGLLNEPGIPNSKIGSFPMLSSTVSALYGIDGVPRMSYDKETRRMTGAVAAQSLDIERLSGSPVNRMGFRDGSLNAISAVLNCFIPPLSACYEYLSGKSIKDIFSDNVELIVNSSAGAGIALDEIALFPDDVRRIFLHRKGIVLEQADAQLCIRVETSQSTFRQAQGERISLDETNLS
jgi:hypothetical protein